jgi:hypothetical protein
MSDCPNLTNKDNTIIVGDTEGNPFNINDAELKNQADIFNGTSATPDEKMEAINAVAAKMQLFKGKITGITNCAEFGGSASGMPASGPASGLGASVLSSGPALSSVTPLVESSEINYKKLIEELYKQSSVNIQNKHKELFDKREPTEDDIRTIVKDIDIEMLSDDKLKTDIKNAIKLGGTRRRRKRKGGKTAKKQKKSKRRYK